MSSPHICAWKKPSAQRPGRCRALNAQMKMFWQPGGGAQPLPQIEGVSVITYNWNVDSDDCGRIPADVDLDTLVIPRGHQRVLGTPVSVGEISQPVQRF
ncbi:MAG: hypothetical protein U0694_15735 [Anaerolineae bacterium]